MTDEYDEEMNLIDNFDITNNITCMDKTKYYCDNLGFYLFTTFMIFVILFMTVWAATPIVLIIIAIIDQQALFGNQCHKLVDMTVNAYQTSINDRYVDMIMKTTNDIYKFDVCKYNGGNTYIKDLLPINTTIKMYFCGDTPVCYTPHYIDVHYNKFKLIVIVWLCIATLVFIALVYKRREKHNMKKDVELVESKK